MTTTVDLAILGAGPAGLGAAYRAARDGHEVMVLEREDRVGGAAGSVEVGGIRVDHGSHRLHRAIDPTILDELQRLLGGDLQRRERRGRIRLAGRWLRFPLGVGDLAKNLPPGFAGRALLDAVTAPLRGEGSTSFDARVRATLGPTMADRFYGPYAVKLWGLEPSDIDVRQADVRISATSVTELARKVLARDSDEPGTFFYPRRGFGQISEALADATRAHGGEVRLGSEVDGISSTDGAVRIRSRGGDDVVARRVWSTIPLPVLARLHEPTPPAKVLEAARSLRTRAMVLVYLVLDTPRYTRYDAHYLPERFTPITRISEPKNYRDGHPGPNDPGDPTDRTVLCAELPCDRDDEWWRADDGTLGRLVVDALRDAGLPEPVVVEVESRRLPAAYPVYPIGFGAHLEVLDGWAESLDRVLTFGRQGLFVHDNTHHALAMAWAAADALGPDGGFDEAVWREARHRFESHVVED